MQYGPRNEKPFYDQTMLDLDPNGRLIHHKKLGDGREVIEAIEDAKVIEIKSKKGHKEERDGVFVFEFEINTFTCQTWRHFFYKSIDEKAAFVGGSTLSVRCLPSQLEQVYQMAKKAVESANAEHAKEHARLLELANKNAVRFKAERAAEEARLLAIEKERTQAKGNFDKLDI